MFTARETEMAERKKAIDLIGARAGGRARGAAPDQSRPQAEKDASADRGAAVRAQAEADADADKIRSMAMRVRAEIEAEGMRLMNEAQNMLTPEARMSALRMRLVDKIEGIIRESVRPMERIEGIKILHVDGLGGGGGGGDGGDGGGGSFADSVVNSALRFRAQAPLVDQLLREIGVEGGDVQRLVGGASGATAALPPAHAASRRSSAVIKVYTSSVIDAAPTASGRASATSTACRCGTRASPTAASRTTSRATASAASATSAPATAA